VQAAAWEIHLISISALSSRALGVRACGRACHEHPDAFHEPVLLLAAKDHVRPALPSALEVTEPADLYPLVVRGCPTGMEKGTAHVIGEVQGWQTQSAVISSAVVGKQRDQRLPHFLGKQEQRSW